MSFKVQFIQSISYLNTDSSNFISILYLRIDLVDNNIQPVSVYDKSLDFGFKINGLTNCFPFIINKVFKKFCYFLISQIARSKRNLNNTDSSDISFII